MTEVYTWLTDQSTALAMTINKKFKWFFKNGNKMNKDKETPDDRFGSWHYKLTENADDTVTIEMPKRVFTSFMKVTKFGNDCINFKSLPVKFPTSNKATGTASAIKGLSYDAFKIGKEAYEKRMKNKSNNIAQ